jgi:regulator of sirC expression with transglutaminase-like and TPR domain
VRRRTLLLLAATATCRDSAPERWSLARAAVAIAESAGEATDTDEAWLLDELGSMCESASRLGLHGADGSAAIVHVLFDKLGFAREVESTDLRFVFLPSVIRERRGSCVGLGTLYLALGEALGFTAHGVLMPGHLYVRQQGPGAPRNVELLRRGEAMSDGWYRERFPVPNGTGDYYGRPLSTEQVLGLLEYNVGNERRRQERYLEAEAAYTRAVRRFPTFAEAHASLGAMQHLLGKLPRAAESYRTAHQLNSKLPGLDANIAMLDVELQGSSQGGTTAE